MSGYVICNVVSYILLKAIGKSIAKGNNFTNNEMVWWVQKAVLAH